MAPASDDANPAHTSPVRAEATRPPGDGAAAPADDGEAWRPSPWSSALAGIAAAAAGLGAAELVASLRPAWPSPVISIGDQVVDRVPQPVKQFAIDTFGTADKAVLLGGIVVVVAAVAAGIGILARTRRVLAVIATIALAAVAGIAALAGSSASALDLVPAVVAAVVAVPLLLVMTPRDAGPRVEPDPDATRATDGDHSEAASDSSPGSDTSVRRTDDIPSQSRTPSHSPPAQPGTDPSVRTTDDISSGTRTPSQSPAAIDPGSHQIPRRRFLALAGGSLTFGLATVAGGQWIQRTRGLATRAAAPDLPTPSSAAPAIPAGAHPDVPGLSSFVTSNDDFYRIDTALTVPRLSADGWTLRIHGMVDREVTFTYDELLAMDSVDVPITLTCVSNEVGGGLVGTARWQGVRLADVLDRAGVADGASQLVGRAHDGWTAGFPTEAAFDRDALVAWGMNGEPLPAAHGFPLRLVTPGLYGYVSATKWLTENEATTFEAFDQYWVERGWVEDAPIKVASRIDTPSGLATVERGSVAVAGVAWAQTRGISRVEVRVDDGEFREAELADEVSADTWRQWVLRWDTTAVEAGRHQLTVRATDGDGVTQPEQRQPPFPSGATGWHSLAVMVTDSQG
ncbi:MAG TPA: molybdopterin-dependent oxidoreductase [Nitriliruptoraceae bacterium]|nr:molybdopterin-dependent oxidoreductase [Nitriliruptoraceae bacterium]